MSSFELYKKFEFCNGKNVFKFASQTFIQERKEYFF